MSKIILLSGKARHGKDSAATYLQSKLPNSTIMLFAKYIKQYAKDYYEIIYFAVDLPKELQDGIKPASLKDRELCKKYGIKVFQDLIKDSWNTTLLKIFANTEYFITMNGGYSILSAYFGLTLLLPPLYAFLHSLNHSLFKVGNTKSKLGNEVLKIL